MPDPNQTDPNNPQPIADSPQTTTFSPVPDPSAAVVGSPLAVDSADQPITPAFQAITEEVPSPQPTPEQPGPTPDQPAAGPTIDYSTGSAAPVNFPAMEVSSPKKKFGGGKVIATILGLFLLVGGVGAGLLLTQQQQLFNQKAAGDCGDGYHLNGKGECVKDDGTGCGGAGNCTSGTHCQAGKCVANDDGGGGGGDVGDECGNGIGACPSEDQACNNGYCVSKGGQHTPPPGGQGECNGCAGPGLGWKWQNDACIAKSDSACDCTAPKPGGGCIYPTTKPGTGCAPGYVADTRPECQDHVNSVCKNGKRCTTPVYDCFKSGAHYSCGPNQCQTSGACSGTQNGSETCVDDASCSGGGGGGDTAQCQNIKAYNASWVLLTAAQLKTLKTGNHVNFCVTGSASGGSFDKAKLTINGAAQAATTTKRPGNQDFCQDYVIPAATTTFNVTAQIHHVTLGWK